MVSTLEVADKLLERIEEKRGELIDLTQAPIVGNVSKAIETIIGKTPENVISPGTCVQKHINRVGNLKNCIAYGPGIPELAHMPDEYVVVEDMIDSAKVMARAMIDILQPDPFL